VLTGETEADVDYYLVPEVDFSFEQVMLRKTCRVRYRLTARDADGEELAREYLQATENFGDAASGGPACLSALMQVFPEVTKAVVSALQ
jgi:hypothetical protein